MKSGYIAIAVLAMIAAVTLLSGCTSGPGMNATVTPTVKATVTPTAVVTAVPMAGVVDAQNASTNASMSNTATPWPEIRSGNNTSVINTSEGMREVPNEMLAGGANNTTGATVAAQPVVSPTVSPVASPGAMP